MWNNNYVHVNLFRKCSLFYLKFIIVSAIYYWKYHLKFIQLWLVSISTFINQLYYHLLDGTVGISFVFKFY